MNPYDRNYKWVYLLTEGKGDMRTLFGGKGAGVSEMLQTGGSGNGAAPHDDE